MIFSTTVYTVFLCTESFK